jgi:hypothetical protein
MVQMTNESSLRLMIRMEPLHFGQTKGSTSYIFWIKQAGLYPDLSTKSNRPIKSKEATLLFAFVLNHLFSRLSIEIGGGF